MQILLIDDHPLILSALKTVIEGFREGVKVICADSAAVARALLKRDADFQLVLLDLHLGDANGLDLLTEFRAAHPSLPVVVISASDRSSDVIRAIDLGAMGYVPKRSSTEMLTQALQLVLSGGIYVPPLNLSLDSNVLAGDPAPAPASIAATAKPAPSQVGAELDGLSFTPRQNDVLALLLQGMPNKLIARELGLSVETVKDHVAAVLKVLGVNSRTQAVLAVSELAQRGAGSFTAWRAR